MTKVSVFSTLILTLTLTVTFIFQVKLLAFYFICKYLIKKLNIEQVYITIDVKQEVIHLPSNGPLQMLTYIFQVTKCVKINAQYLENGGSQRIMFKYDFSHRLQPTTLASTTLAIEWRHFATAVHRDLDLYFKGHNISGNINVYSISKTVNASEKRSIMTFIKVDTIHRMAPLQMLNIMILIYII